VGAARSAPAKPPATSKPTPPGGARRHVVAPGDTLYKIAQRYYGNGAKWTTILEANRDVLQNQNAVRVGMELKIP
jgi:5'-nucleotidase / UDP-sugar diphosphatase